MKYEYFTDYTEIIVYWAIFVAICLALIIIIPDPNLSFQRVYQACSRGGASRSAPVCGSTLSAMALHERPGFVRFPDDPSRIRVFGFFSYPSDKLLSASLLPLITGAIVHDRFGALSGNAGVRFAVGGSKVTK